MTPAIPFPWVQSGSRAEQLHHLPVLELIPLRIWAKDVAVLPVTADSDDEAAEMEVDD